MASSIEPNIAELANGWLKSYKLDYKLEQESLSVLREQVYNPLAFSLNDGTDAVVNDLFAYRDYNNL